MTPEIDALIRLAEQSADAAETLLNRGHFRFSVSRSYYTMFYCIEALLLSAGRSYSKHSAVIAAFGQHFVKTGLFEKSFYDHLRKAFEDRQRGDYEAMEQVSRKTAITALNQSREFLQATKAFLHRKPPDSIGPEDPSGLTFPLPG